jgi:hypothetical protein
MLRLTADVNGAPIGYVFIHNAVQLPSDEGTLCLYNAATWDPKKQDGLFGVENIAHIREHGWVELAAKVLRRIG